MNSDFLTDPYVIIIGLMFLVVLVYLWSRKNTSTNRKRQQRSFRDEYYRKKKEREELQK
jgi:H+/Cl- antiporter ClcA